MSCIIRAKRQLVLELGSHPMLNNAKSSLMQTESTLVFFFFVLAQWFCMFLIWAFYQFLCNLFVWNLLSHLLFPMVSVQISFDLGLWRKSLKVLRKSWKMHNFRKEKQQPHRFVWVSCLSQRAIGIMISSTSIIFTLSPQGLKWIPEDLKKILLMVCSLFVCLCLRLSIHLTELNIEKPNCAWAVSQK